MRSLLVLAPLVLTTGCLTQEPPLAEVLVAWDSTLPRLPTAEVETHVAVYDTATGGQIDGEYAPGYAGDVVLTMEPRPAPVRVCVQHWSWSEVDSPRPWCAAPCLELVTYGSEQCEELIVESDVHLTFAIH